MSITIESDLKEILTKLDQKIDKLDQKIDKLSDDTNQRIDKLSTEMNQKIDKLSEDMRLRFEKVNERFNKIDVSIARLDEKTEGLSKRIDSQEFVNRGVLIGLIVAILGGAAKLFGLVGNP